MLGAAIVWSESASGVQALPQRGERQAEQVEAADAVQSLEGIGPLDAERRRASDEVVAEVDRLIAAGLGEAGLEPTESLPADQWARRVFFDLVGRPPTVDEQLMLQVDSGFERAALVDSLLNSEQYAANWARYWRDTIFYRRTEERSPIVMGATEEYLRRALAANRSWADVATDFVTASGDSRENGHAGLIVAQGGRPEETVSEVSRIFLGIQIQCAQCHDHPTDRWTREQFHQLAAFFPRVSARFNQEERTFVVSGQDRFARVQRPNPNRFVGMPEHLMPDLNDPDKPGESMQPIFFVDARSLPFGATDAERRESLAAWMTDPQNEWFAKAAVNRVWSELIGRSFYDAVDDIGPDRTPISPEVLDTLADGFAASGYDFAWLLRTVALTDLYGRRSIESSPERPAAWIAPYRVPLRSDQIFDRLVQALQVNERQLPTVRRERGMGPADARRGLQTLFGFDPSDSREEWAESIPQALFLMNGPVVDGFVRGENGLSARVMRETDRLEIQVDEIYAYSLARLPTDEERSVVRRHLESVPERREGLEDLHWSLINSSEFLHRD